MQPYQQQQQVYQQQPQYGQYPMMQSGYNPNPYNQGYPPNMGMQQQIPQGYPAYPQPNQPMMMQQPGGYDNQGYPPAPPPANLEMPVVQMQPMIQNNNIPYGNIIVVDTTNQHKHNNLPTSANGVPHPARVYCSSCDRGITTQVTDKAGTGTYTWCILLCLVAPVICCLPFCVSSCQDKIHTCPNCQSTVGIYEYKVC